jgi:hypothetical protein
MDMFNKKSIVGRVGNTIHKSATLNHLKEVEKYFLQAIAKYRIEISYDVVANEIPYFKTMNYTEWAHTFIMHPLNQDLRVKQLQDAWNDNCAVDIDYIAYFKNRILTGQSNKYTHIQKATEHAPRENLVVLVGSNMLKDRLCLNKLRWIKDKHEDEVYFKPHPLTTYQLIGELKDLFGSDTVLDRDADMYTYLVEAKNVYTSHMSESAMYATALGKTIEPIDVFNKVEQGSFYHINKYLFIEDNAAEWANRAFNSPKSGIVNPEIDTLWKKKIDDYLEYITEQRNKFKNKYITK